jgi:hypothetical protein
MLDGPGRPKSFTNSGGLPRSAFSTITCFLPSSDCPSESAGHFDEMLSALFRRDSDREVVERHGHRLHELASLHLLIDAHR